MTPNPDAPFISIHPSLFSKHKFLSFLGNINQKLFIPEIATIIYQILCGYRSTINLNQHFPSELMADLHGKDQIESYRDPEVCDPPCKLQNLTWLKVHPYPLENKLEQEVLQNLMWLKVDPYPLKNKLEQEVKDGCSQCKPCYDEFEEISIELVKSELNIRARHKYHEDDRKCEAKEEHIFSVFCTKLAEITLPEHIHYNWDAFPILNIDIIRNCGDDQMTILLHMKDNIFEPTRLGDNTYALEMFKCNDIMPYFKGAHYAYLLKLILDRYHFEKKHYRLIHRVGLTWSITNDISVKREFLAKFKIINPNVCVSYEFFHNPVSIEID